MGTSKSIGRLLSFPSISYFGKKPTKTRPGCLCVTIFSRDAGSIYSKTPECKFPFQMSRLECSLPAHLRRCIERPAPLSMHWVCVLNRTDKTSRLPRRLRRRRIGPLPSINENRLSTTRLAIASRVVRRGRADMRRQHDIVELQQPLRHLRLVARTRRARRRGWSRSAAPRSAPPRRPASRARC